MSQVDTFLGGRSASGEGCWEAAVQLTSGGVSLQNKAPTSQVDHAGLSFESMACARENWLSLRSGLCKDRLSQSWLQNKPVQLNTNTIPSCRTDKDRTKKLKERDPKSVHLEPRGLQRLSYKLGLGGSFLTDNPGVRKAVFLQKGPPCRRD